MRAEAAATGRRAVAGATRRAGPVGLAPGRGAVWLAWLLRDRAQIALAEARGQLFVFVPVFLAIGIGTFFALARDPAGPEWAAIGALGAGLGLIWWRGPEAVQPLAMAALLVVAGLGLGGLRAQLVAAPVLNGHFHGAIQGRIVMIDRSGSDAVRLTLDQVVLEGRAPARTPARVRVALHGDQGFVAPEAGMVVILTGHLSPPAAPAEPGGFDFRRMAWFERLGAVGYTRTPVLMLAPARPDGPRQAITRLRLHLSVEVQAAIPGEAGAFAAAILTGDRSGISQETLEALRGSNLAHLLAISGLHMGLLTGLVFGALRLGFAMVPVLALRLPCKKLAALGALAAAAFYLALSGGNVATERAFIMVAVMLGAVLVDQRAVSMRSVAIAAVLILALRPESLLSAGFQMSFAATAALVAVFGALSFQARAEPERRRRPRWVSAVVGVVLCSLVAGLATAPVAAAQFNRLSEYGLLANVLSVPLMGSVVMPAAILAGVLWPFGLGWVGLRVMELGTLWILGVADWVAGLDGAVIPVAAPPGWALPVLALGALWLMLWPGPARLAGAVVAAAALLGWGQAQRPALLVADTGTLIGVIGPEGRVLSKASGERFAATQWLQSDGDGAAPESAAARPGLGGPAGARRFDLGDVPGLHLTGRGAADRLEAACRPGVLVISGAASGAAPTGQGAAARLAPDGALPLGPGGCWLIDVALLAETGALALSPGPEGAPRATSATARAGQRAWTR